jgi:hypothetical protein
MMWELLWFAIGVWIGLRIPKTIEAAKPYWYQLVAIQRAKIDNERNKSTHQS